MQSRAKPTMDDLARNNIALHRLAQVHLRCVEIAHLAEAAEQEAKESPSIGSNQDGLRREEQTDVGNLHISP